MFYEYGPLFSVARGVLSRVAVFVVLLRKWAKLRNLDFFSAEIVQFLENTSKLMHIGGSLVQASRLEM